MLNIILTDVFHKTLTVTVAGGPGNIRDYVALYLSGAANYLTWLYVATGTQIRAPKGSATGAVKFTILKPGSYEAKLFSLTDNGVAALLETFPFVAGIVVTPPPPPGGVVTNSLLVPVTDSFLNPVSI